MSELVLVGLNHRSAGVGTRERVGFEPYAAAGALADLTARAGIEEALLLSTCNRVEVVSRVEDSQTGFASISAFLSETSGLTAEELAPCLYHYASNEAVRHVFRVAASLDSMVLGEPQILGQVKAAYGQAVEAETAGTLLNSLFQAAFRVAKRVRTETGIGEYSVSVSSAAVELARKILGDLGDRLVLIVGAGKMGEGTARHLMSNGAGRIFVTNRSADAAAELAARFNGTAVAFDQLSYWVHQADVVIVSTAAPAILIDRGMVESTMRKRRGTPLVFIDISVPRNVDPAVGQIDNVFCYDIDDLGAVVQANLDERRRSAATADRIVIQEAEAFSSRMKTLDVTPMVVEVRRRIDEICRSELERFLRKAGPRNDRETRELETMVSRIAGKISHPLVTQLKTAHQDPSHQKELLSVVTRLFKFHREPE